MKTVFKQSLSALSIVIFTFFTFGCGGSDGTKNSKQEIEPPKESELFSDLLGITKILNQFEGSAFLSDPVINANCNMVLANNPQGDDITKLSYQINSYYHGRPDKVDETFTVTELKRKSKNRDYQYWWYKWIYYDDPFDDYLFGSYHSAGRDYEDAFLFGSVKGLKSSIINEGKITDAVNGINSLTETFDGNIWFALDSVNLELVYVMASDDDWVFQGSIKPEVEQYIKLKELFTNKKLSENEVKAIYKSRNLIELISNDTNFIDLGNNKYKVLISKTQLINKSRIKPLFTLKIKNVSNRNIHSVSLSTLYESTPESVYRCTPSWSQDAGLNPLTYEVLQHSTLGSEDYMFNYGSTIKFSELEDYYRYIENLSEDRQLKFIKSLSKEVNFTFNLIFTKPDYWFNYGKSEPVNFREMTIAEILDNKEFLDIWEIINEYPAITFKINVLGDVPIDVNSNGRIHDGPEIYFELID